MLNIDWDKIAELLKYHQNYPLIFSSGLFLFLFACFSLFYSMMGRRVMLRIIYVVLFSLYFYYNRRSVISQLKATVDRLPA